MFYLKTVSVRGICAVPPFFRTHSQEASLSPGLTTPAPIRAIAIAASKSIISAIASNLHCSVPS